MYTTRTEVGNAVTLTCPTWRGCRSDQVGEAVTTTEHLVPGHISEKPKVQGEDQLSRGGSLGGNRSHTTRLSLVTLGWSWKGLGRLWTRMNRDYCGLDCELWWASDQPGLCWVGMGYIVFYWLLCHGWRSLVLLLYQDYCWGVTNKMTSLPLRQCLFSYNSSHYEQYTVDIRALNVCVLFKALVCLLCEARVRCSVEFLVCIHVVSGGTTHACWNVLVVLCFVFTKDYFCLTAFKKC